MKKSIILSLAMIVAIGAVVVGATGAFFSDTETSTGNTFTAGQIDLKIDSTCHYDGMICKDGYWVDEDQNPDNNPIPEMIMTSCVCSWGMDEFTGQPFFSYDDVKPGDWGENTISFHIASNPAWACLEFDNIVDSDYTCTEPEQVAEDGNCDPDNDGELDENMYIKMWIDDGDGADYDPCDNVWEEGEEVVLDNELLSQYERDGRAILPIASADTETLRHDPIPAGDYCVGLAWSIPGEETGNEVQTDKLGADLNFYVEQSRNNPDFSCFQID